MRHQWLSRCFAIALIPSIAALPLLAQKTQSDKTAEQQNREAGQGDSSGAPLGIQPGAPTIKTKDITQERKIAPWERLPRYFLQDQKAIWTSPFHTSKAEAKWWLVFGGTTAALLASDKWTSKQLPNTSDQIAVSKWTSRLGAGYSLLPISGTFYFIGLGAHDERFRETGILGFEALADTAAVGMVLKLATRRERPLEGDGNGGFWAAKSSFWNSGFPSGHALSSWALASVVAHEYPHPLIVPITAYALATTVCVSRLTVRQHFASDIVVGAGMGWFIGDYIFLKRHNRDLEKPSAIERLKAHVHIGGPARAAQLNNPEAERSALFKEMSTAEN